MREEVLRVLKLIEEGKIDAEKGAELIEALKENKEEVMAVPHEEKVLKIRVLSHEQDKVNVNLPLKLVKALLSSTGKLPGMQFDGEGIDPKVILEAIESGIDGKIVEVNSGEGDLVEIFIE